MVSPVRAALSQRLGRKVATSVVYRFLERHRWRKVAPDTRQPRSDPRIQEDWEKKLPQDLDALLTPEAVGGRRARFRSSMIFVTV